MELRRHVSFVDCPGHDILMATMLNGAAVMDGALLLIAANETCPQPQTSEHLAAVEIMKLEHLLILQNKIDLVDEGTAGTQHETIKKFVQARSEFTSALPCNRALTRCTTLSGATENGRTCPEITARVAMPLRSMAGACVA